MAREIEQSTVMRFWFALVAFALTVNFLSADDRVIDFDDTIAPILAKHCLSCHSGDDPKSQLDLSRRKSAFRGESGVVLVPGNLDESPFWHRIVEGEMPPEEPLGKNEQDIIKRWIESGAAWGTDPIDPFSIPSENRAGYDWWSLQPLQTVSPPKNSDSTQSVHPIDAFIQARLSESGLQPSPPATDRELIRRMKFDLLGLPPTPEEVERLSRELQQDPEKAISAMADEFLSSKHFGERWARHWLDVVRFGESQGFERDKLRTDSWHYRDWVIQVLNDDMPYDEFVRLQLAGDVLRPDDPDAITATGFLVAGAWDEVGHNQQSGAMKAVVRQDELEDYVATIGQAFLGLTIHCARCHDHKFDPISQKEYYQLAAAVAGVNHGSRQMSSNEDRHELDQITRELERVKEEIEKAKALAESHAVGQSERVENLEKDTFRLAELQKRLRPRTVYAVTAKKPHETFVLARGNPNRKGERVKPGGVHSVSGVDGDFGIDESASDADRRRALANWIASEKNPLFARVIVNRIWHHHFGVGLVETPNDFGFNGGKPSHPQLLDYLAGELIESGFRRKHIHRLIVTSATYQQSSRFRRDSAEIDAGNRLLWRKSPVRLDAETLRDTLLSVSGQLNPQFGGAPYQDFTTHVHNSQFYDIVDKDTSDVYRRTIYRTWIRSGRSPLLDVFDCPDPSTTAPKRTVTTTPLQALAMMNNSFVLRMADRFAQRVEREAGPNLEDQIQRVSQLAFSREFSDAESQRAEQFVRGHGLSAFCRVVFNSNEFIHVD